tara:strand:+ start:67 stop:1629 length:1563 start_codon:yes stop_codon:yes gene_type:complete
MSDDAKPKSRFDFDLPEIKPIQAFGRVWKVWELNVIWFFAFFISYLLLGIFLGHWFSLLIVFCVFFVLGKKWEKHSEESETPYIIIKSSGEGKKLPSKEEVTEWTKKNSEYFMAWNKRQYKASTTWLGQRKEDWVEWRHQRKLAKYRAEPQPDPGVEVAVSEVMEESTDPLAEGAMAKMIDPEPESTERIEEEQTLVVIPQPPVFATNRVEFNPRKPSVDFDWVPSFFRTATKVYFAINAFLFSLALFNYAYEMDLFFWPLENWFDFIAERLLGEYSGTFIGVKIRAIVLGTLLLCVSLLMLIGYRPSVTILLLGFTFLLSFLMRMNLTDPFSNGGDILKDSIWCFYFLVYGSIIFFARDPDIDHPLLGPQELISPSTYGGSGERLELMKPKRPTRRARPLFFYEGVFLLVAMILWPLSLFSLAALASTELRINLGLPSDFNSASMSGQLFLAILFSLSMISTYIVYKFDREARDAPMYAKEMEAYVKHMEHWININNDYYEREHARLTADLPKNKSSEE